MELDYEEVGKQYADKKKEETAKYMLAGDIIQIFKNNDVTVSIVAPRITGIPIAVFIDTGFTFNVFVPRESTYRTDLLILEHFDCIPIKLKEEKNEVLDTATSDD